MVIIAASRLAGALFRRIGQPQVMGEIVAGILLGPSLLGAVWPSGQDALFSAEVLPFIEVLAQIGLVLFMFLIGLELDLRLIKGGGHAAAAVSHASIILPFLSGVALALVIFDTLGSADGDFVPFALFLGASMSITAFPVLARILTERGLNKTRLGAVTITCAAIDDVTAWCLLAVVVAVAAASGIGGAVQTVVLAALFIAFMIVVIRPLLARLVAMQDEASGLTPTMLAVIFGGLLLSSLATDRIGIHAIFGAFLFGAIMPQQSDFAHELTSKLEDVTLVFLLPLFFAYSGLRTEIGQLGTDPQLWLYCVAIIGVAIVGKWGGSAVAARMVGLSWRESLGLGILMNCRGLTELVILNIGLDLGVIPPTLFAMLVMMALVTTFMTTPILGAIYPPAEQQRMIAEEGGEDDGVFRILVHVPSLDKAYELVHTALSLARDQDEPAEVILLRTLGTSDSAVRSGLRQESRGERAANALRPLVEFVQGAGFEAVPLVVSTGSVGESIVRVATERSPDLVLMSMRKPFFGSRLLGGSLGWPRSRPTPSSARGCGPRPMPSPATWWRRWCGRPTTPIWSCSPSARRGRRRAGSRSGVCATSSPPARRRRFSSSGATGRRPGGAPDAGSAVRPSGWRTRARSTCATLPERPPSTRPTSPGRSRRSCHLARAAGGCLASNRSGDPVVPRPPTP